MPIIHIIFIVAVVFTNDGVLKTKNNSIQKQQSVQINNEVAQQELQFISSDDKQKNNLL